MKKVLLASALCLSMFSAPTAGYAGDETKNCAKQPLTFACLDHYAQRNQDNVAKVLDDVSAGRLPTLRPPALPLLEGLPTVDLEKVMSAK